MLNIIHLDKHILVLDKPAGLPVLPDGWEKGAPYLVRMLEEQFSKIRVVHRLDKFTSGVMVFARTAEGHRELNRQFERREAEKTYHAILVGIPAWEEKTAKHPLRADVGHSHRTVVDFKRGKTAETRFKVVKRLAGHGLVEASPRTGRTHQIRAHAAALGHPLQADVLYGAPSTDLIARPALHALSLAFVHPESVERLTFTAPYPGDFAEALERLKV